MKIRENRMEILRQMQSDKWYTKNELQNAEIFLLDRMAKEGLIESKFEYKTGSFKYRIKEVTAHLV